MSDNKNENISKDSFFKRNKNRILYGVAIVLPCLSIIILIAGKPSTWFEKAPADSYSKNAASSASGNTSTSSTSTSSGSSSSSSSSTSTSGTKKSTVNVNGAASKSNSSAKSNSSSTSKSSSSSKSSGSGSSSSKSKSNARKAAENYDAGYNAIYEDDDYSQSRYNRDKDYAMGVDDAMDDLDWD